MLILTIPIDTDPSTYVLLCFTVTYPLLTVLPALSTAHHHPAATVLRRRIPDANRTG